MKFYWPYRNLKWPITDTCQNHINTGRHCGIDIAPPINTPILCAQNWIDESPARVKFAGWNTIGYGNLVIVSHGGGNNFETWYGHMKKIHVKGGQRVRAGDVLGLTGSTGNSTGPHLHYGILRGGVFVDPLKWMYYPRQAPPDELPPGDYMIGIDVSRYQGSMNWVKAVSAGAKFAIIRATSGMDYQDPKFREFYNGAKNAGLLVGAYHVLRPSQSVGQITNFLQAADGCEFDLPVAFDCERDENKSKSHIKNLLVNCIKGMVEKQDDSFSYSSKYLGWNADMYERYYHQFSDYVPGTCYPQIYTGSAWWNAHVGEMPEWDYVPLWIAHYTTGQPAYPSVWNTYTIHQFSAGGNKRGAEFGAGSTDIDIDRWNPEVPWIGDYGDEPPPPPPPPVAAPVSMAIDVDPESLAGSVLVAMNEEKYEGEFQLRKVQVIDS